MNKKVTTNPVGNAETMKSSSSIGDALRGLASRRQKIAKQSQLIAQAQLRQAESELQDQRKLKREKDILVSQIENSKRKQINTVKLKAKAKMRDAFLSRLKKKKAMDSHQALIDASNSRILSRYHKLEPMNYQWLSCRRQGHHLADFLCN